MLEAGPLSLQVIIEMLSDDLLLNIFHHFLHASPQFWHTLTQVCQKWRQIIFGAPVGLRLRLHCTYGTPVMKTLGYWPPFPLVVNYAGNHPLAPEDEDNIIAALQHADRVHSISFTVSRSLLNKLSTISEPFLELEDLVLLSNDNSRPTLPSGFWWGHRLRTLHSTGVAFHSLPQLLLPSQNLVEIKLDKIPSAGYFSPEAFANALCGMSQLQTLALHFLSYPPRRNYLSLPPSPWDRVVLPVLTGFRYRGVSKYLDSLVARIDAPRLGDIGDIDITFFSQPTMEALQLGLFISRIESWRPPSHARIVSSLGVISISFTYGTHLWLEVPCEQLDWQLSSISQICDHFPSLFGVENLDIETVGRSKAPDDMDDEQWLRLICPFSSAKYFCVSNELATDILRVLRLADEGHKIVLPALRNLLVRQRPVSPIEPFWDSVESFITQRQLIGLAVQVNIQQGTADDPIPVAKWRSQLFSKPRQPVCLEAILGHLISTIFFSHPLPGPDDTVFA
jgi:hypothetical protein